MVEFALVISLAVRSCRGAGEAGMLFPTGTVSGPNIKRDYFYHFRKKLVLSESSSAIVSIVFVIDWIFVYLKGFAP